MKLRAGKSVDVRAFQCEPMKGPAVWRGAVGIAKVNLRAGVTECLEARDAKNAEVPDDPELCVVDGDTAERKDAAFSENSQADSRNRSRSETGCGSLFADIFP